MKKLYEEIMDKIEVTEEMHDRIMDNIQNMDLEKPSRILRMRRLRLYTSLAACCVVLVAGIMVTRINRLGEMNSFPTDIEVTDESTETTERTTGPVNGSQPTNVPVEVPTSLPAGPPENSPPTFEDPEVGWIGGEEEGYVSAQELSEAVGFDIVDVPGLPFEPKIVEYSIWTEGVAQIQYISSKQFAIFRKSEGNEDNTSYVDSYTVVKEITVDGNTVTLKGDEDEYRLAIWFKNGYTYSLDLQNGVPEAQWQQIIPGIE